MAEESGDIPPSFDLRFVRKLVKLMDDNELSELDLREGSRRIRLRKRGSDSIPVIAGAAPAPVAFVERPAAAATPAVERNESAASNSFTEIKSEMVGTFYTASSPDAPPFVSVGAHVEPESVVCIIEAMKVFNEIQAGTRGKVVAVLVENGQPVEFGQALFRLDPAG